MAGAGGAISAPLSPLDTRHLASGKISSRIRPRFMSTESRPLPTRIHLAPTGPQRARSGSRDEARRPEDRQPSGVKVGGRYKCCIDTQAREDVKDVR